MRDTLCSSPRRKSGPSFGRLQSESWIPAFAGMTNRAMGMVGAVPGKPKHCAFPVYLQRCHERMSDAVASRLTLIGQLRHGTAGKPGFEPDAAERPEPLAFA